MTLQAGMTAELQVFKEVSPYGYFLTDGKRDVLLHYSEVTGEIQTGDMVEVFLFHDTEDRLSATMKRPFIRLGELALLEVADIHPKLGCFLDIGLGRNLLLPNRELPLRDEWRPVVGDRIYVVLDHDKQGRMIGRLAGENELAPLCIRAPGSWKNQWVEARVYNPLQKATFVICDGGVLGFGVIGMIHESERPGTLRLGEALKVRVTFVRDDGRVNLSMRARKEHGRIEDADRILAALRERPAGAMPYSDDTPVEVITEVFSMSKSAFKWSLGKLMKEGQVYQENGWTYLQKQPSE